MLNLCFTSEMLRNRVVTRRPSQQQSPSSAQGSAPRGWERLGCGHGPGCHRCFSFISGPGEGNFKQKGLVR